MDTNYDSKAAIKYLEDIVARRGDTTDSDVPITRLGDAQLKTYEVVKFASPLSWRLTTNIDTDSEATFRMQGILCAFQLPPVKSTNGMQKKRFFLRQSITLTGLSTESFDRAASACEAIYAKMSAHFLVGSVNHWENTVYEGHAATDFNARYFTRRNDAPNEVNLTFGDGVDPNGVLGMLRGHDLIHGPDNQVVYLKALSGGGYSTIRPAALRLGDIVEVTIAFVVLPVRGQRYIMTPQLRAITLLEDKIRQRSSQEAREVIGCKQKGQLKRKVLYTAENPEDETRGKMAKMQIDEQSSKS